MFKNSQKTSTEDTTSKNKKYITNSNELKRDKKIK